MPVYSISRTNQYTTVPALETKTNQDGVSFNGFDAQGYASNFSVTLLTVCPTANQTWNYFNATSPTAASVWYPYSITLTVSGGNPLGNGARPGIAYLNLYTSAGGYLMGSYTSNSLAYAGTTSITLTTGPPVQATTFNITNSRNTLTITGDTGYLAGFVAPTTGTLFWNIFARATAQTAQNVYYDTSVTYNGTFSTATVNNSTQSLMGFINYNAAPVKPTNLVITTTTTGIQITCQCNEVQSLSVSSGTTVGDVSQILFLYSENNVTYKVLTTDTSITRTLVSGLTTYQYVANASGTYTNKITLGRKYYFKVAAINDLCIQYQAESSTTRVAAGEDSDASFAQYGRQQFIKIRNVTNTAWVYPLDVNLVPTLTRIRNLGDTQWIYGDVYIRDASGNWVLN
jgi:hypothetical protein